MESIIVYRSLYRCLASGQEFYKAGFARDFSQDYGQKYYVTEDGEAAIVDLIVAEPEGMRELDRYIKDLWTDFGPKDILNGLTNVQQAAWRFFADLSHNGRLWYFERMKGHPICGKFVMHKPGEITTQLYINVHRIGQEEELEVQPQAIGFSKWLNSPDVHKRNLVQQFLASPEYYDVRSLSDPIYPHPFHPEMSV